MNETIYLSNLIATTYFLDKRYDNVLSGNLQLLSNNFIIGNNTISTDNQHLSVSNSIVAGNNNKVLVPYSINIGYNNWVGCNGYKILSAWYATDQTTTNKDVIISIDVPIGQIDTACSGLIYSVEYAGSTADIGRVISIDNSNSTLRLSDFKSSIAYSLPIYCYYIFFKGHPEIGNTVVENAYSYAFGQSNNVNGWNSFAEGRFNEANGRYSHVEGKQNTTGWAAHAEGCANRALGECSHVNGRVNTVYGSYGFSSGNGNRIERTAPTAMTGGYLARAKDECTFVWNGEKKYGYRGNPTAPYNYSEAGIWTLPDSKIPITEQNRLDKQTMEYMDSELVLSSMYESHGVGTFNINPQNGISGFYIGEQTLAQILKNASGNEQPLSGRTYSLAGSALSTVLIDIITALGGKVED